MALPTTLGFWCETVAVTSARTNLWTLIQAAFTANARTDIIDSQVASFQLTAEAANSVSIFVGDATLVASATPSALKGCGAQLAATQGLFSEGNISTMTNDLSQIYVRTIAVTAYLLVRVVQK